MTFIGIPDDKLELIRKFASEIRKVKDVLITVDEKRKVVTVRPAGDNVYDALKVESAILAITYGFSPEQAMKLLGEDYSMQVIDLKDFTRDPQAMKRLKGRIIGSEGKFKRSLQEYTSTEIVVGERYVALIGPYDQVDVAKSAIEMLINGADHSKVYRFLDNAERALLERRFSLLKSNKKFDSI